jgi:hypothetical protein
MTAARSLAARRFATALTFDSYRHGLSCHREEFEAHYERLGETALAFPTPCFLPRTSVLAITEDWCPDSVLNTPLMARFVERSRGASLRIVRRRDEPALAEAHPGRGGSSRIPTFIFLAPDGAEVGYWSERSRSEHAWMAAFTANDPLPELVFKDHIPEATLLAWMRRRIAAQQERYYGATWRETLEELRDVATRGGISS